MSVSRNVRAIDTGKTLHIGKTSFQVLYRQNANETAALASS